MKLDPKVKAKWVKALRSGKYKKTAVGRLKYHGRFCCLGVACEIGIAKPLLETAEQTKSPINVDTDFLPFEIQNILTRMNDGFGNGEHNSFSFKQIADWIEGNL